ncbi:MAG: adenylyltransferase/cytidyltransferase family protein [Cellvibrionaceae bacterium]|nr:adenylyltransferase/cytidyltransferase family protein [Cellvibrionaceae bacterium]
MNKNHIAVFGSAFNPPHLGHADVIQQVLQHSSQLVLVPCFQHAFAKKMMPFEFRLEMLSAMLSDLNIAHLVKVSQIEREIAHRQRRPGEALPPVYTFQVLEALERELGSSQLVFVVGPDNARPETWSRFYKADEISQRWQIWPAQERLPIRSTAIRRKLANNEALDTAHCTQGVIQLLKGYQL